MRGDAIESRVVNFLLQDPIPDGGQWDMVVNLINQYGLMPKACFPETFSSESSGHLNALLKSKLREYAQALRVLIDSKATEEQVYSCILFSFG